MKTLISLFLTIILTTATFAQNLEEQEQPLRSPFQVTLFCPPFSTNGAQNVDYVNDVSLNLFIGISGGTEMMELGGFINIDRFNVNGVQLAGFGNTVGGSAHGVQIAGFYNVNGGNTDVVQIAGFANTVGGSVTGFQAAGFINVAGGPVTGLQGAGFMNVAGNGVTGLQGAGFMNMAGNNTVGLQGAGFMNITGRNSTVVQGSGFANIAGGTSYGIQGAGFGNFSGEGNINLQGAGFINLADRVTGGQGAGFMNIAREVRGIQGSGFMNIAGYVRGVQATGFINICDSIDGVPIGFISIVKHGGYRRLEVNASELMYAAVSWKMGVKRLYNIFTIGKPFGPANSWLYGWGLGSEFDLSNRVVMNVEAVSHQEMILSFPWNNWMISMNELNMYNQMRMLFGWNVAPKVAVFAGPTFNVAVASTAAAGEPLSPTDYAPSWSFYNHTYTNPYNTNVRMWFGVHAGLRFF
ncbi:MAG: hypothetical protein ACOYXB_16905 [Bacteroidota bacterium]